VLPCLLSYLVSENEALRSGAVRALRVMLKSRADHDDTISRLLSRITRGKSQAGIIADASYASVVSKVVRFGHVSFCIALTLLV